MAAAIPAQFEARIRNPQYDFDIITDGLSSTYFSGPELKQYYGSATADVSVFNVAGLKSPGVDKLIEVVMAATTRENLTIATKALDRALRQRALDPSDLVREHVQWALGYHAQS